MSRRTNKRTDGRTDGWMDGWRNEKICGDREQHKRAGIARATAMNGSENEHTQKESMRGVECV